MLLPQDALGLGAGAPAGPTPDHPDPRTEGVAVGDFKGLREALAATRDTPTGSSTSDPGPTDAAPPAQDAATDSAGAADTAPGVDSQAMKQGYEDMKSQVSCCTWPSAVVRGVC